MHATLINGGAEVGTRVIHAIIPNNMPPRRPEARRMEWQRFIQRRLGGLSLPPTVIITKGGWVLVEFRSSSHELRSRGLSMILAALKELRFHNPSGGLESRITGVSC